VSYEMSAIVFETCLPIEDHARIAMAWRNDPVTLSMSFHRREKIWESFWPEYRSTYFSGGPDLHPVFAVLDGERIGFLRFDPVPRPGLPHRTVDLSINISPQWRGKGLGRRVIAAALERLGSLGVESVHAEVLIQNHASIRTFEAAGFQLLGRADKPNPETGEADRIVRFVAELWKPQAIFFDLDGTLADSLAVMRQAYSRFLGSFQVQGTDDEFASLNGPPLAEIVRRLAAAHGIAGDPEELQALYGEIIDEAYESVAPTPGAARCLEKAKDLGCVVGIVTSNSNLRTRRWLDTAGLSRWVDVVVSGDDVRHGKPDPEGYVLASQRAGCPPSRILAIEDSQQGARAALAAGLKTFLLAEPAGGVSGAAGEAPGDVPDAAGAVPIRRLCDIFDTRPFVG
jgi:HAD superfamily hydrolase (TIGR01509 family)